MTRLIGEKLFDVKTIILLISIRPTNQTFEAKLSKAWMGLGTEYYDVGNDTIYFRTRGIESFVH